MDIKINSRMLSIPPYLSTTWDLVRVIGVMDDKLRITLADGTTVDVPDLPHELIEKVFTTHQTQVDKRKNANLLTAQRRDGMSSLKMSPASPLFQIGFATLDEMGGIVQHDPSQSNAPPLPLEVLEKITTLTRAIVSDDTSLLPTPVAGCHCMHCQIARAVRGEETDEELVEDEEVEDTELTFEQWVVESTGDHLFTVINKLDVTERYSVYLGSPVGCTCGIDNCEHIIAALRS